MKNVCPQCKKQARRHTLEWIEKDRLFVTSIITCDNCKKEFCRFESKPFQIDGESFIIENVWDLNDKRVMPNTVYELELVNSNKWGKNHN